MPLCAIAYVSDVAGPLAAAHLDALVEDAIRFNSLAGVTGVLLCDGSRFLQYFEGPDDGVSAVHERVLQARSHRAIHKLGHARVRQRNGAAAAVRRPAPARAGRVAAGALGSGMR